MNKFLKRRKALNSWKIACALAIFVICVFALLPHHSDVATGISLALGAPPMLLNKARLQNRLSGITGVGSGATAHVNLPVDRRYHRLILQTFTDLGGGGGVVAAAPDAVIDTITLLVNGVAVRSVSADTLLRLQSLQAPLISLGFFGSGSAGRATVGELAIEFTEPLSMNVNEPPDLSSWDMAGQNTFQLQIKLLTGLTTPAITGIMEYDYERNLLPNGTPFLMPVAQRELNFQMANGLNDIVNIPTNYPIRRIFLLGTTWAGGGAPKITDISLKQDGNIVLEATQDELSQLYGRYGYVIGSAFYGGTSGGTSGFEAAYMADADGRFWNSLKAKNELLLRVNYAAAENLKVILETLPGSFAA